MTNDARSTNVKPIVALLCTRDMEAFLSNSIRGILQVGVDPSQIHVGCPNNALQSVSSVTGLHSNQIHVFSNQTLSENEEGMKRYSRFASRSFVDISWKKTSLIKELLELHDHVIYSDLDIAWIRNPIPYLSQVASVYPMAFQTEGLAQFPPALCCGFGSFLKSKRTIEFFNALIEFDSTQGIDHSRLADQAACQLLIERDIAWLQDIYFLPEALFLNGLGYRNLQNSDQSPCSMEGNLSPFIFHANWTIGLSNKRKLLARTGRWLVGDTPESEPELNTSGSSVEFISPLEQRAPNDSVELVLSVIYPVFDTRGDAIDRIRLWTEEQDFDPHRYRVIVVAGPETDLDEARLRQSLRSHDIILRVPRIGREADYWNAGARESTTPWILFVEAHGMPTPDSLSALAAWIDANPDGEACNFKIENLDHHLVAKLMKRWFAQIHDSWNDPATWRRLHRTAFAMRRDVFEDVGPFEPEYGQFAPPFLSARMHQRGFAISTVPTSSVVHDDAPEMSAHHDDTADYVRGEMNARMRSEPAFFEKYFGASPLYGEDLMLPARHARSILKGILVGALHWPGDAFRLVKRARCYFPAAFLGLRPRARLLAMLTRADEIAVMRLSRFEGLRWRRFLLAHRRVAQTERMLWLERHPLPPLQSTDGNGRLPIDKIGHHALIGLFEMEHFEGKALRWTQPVFLLRLEPLASKVSVILETGNLRRLALSDILVVVDGRVLAPEAIAIDEMGNIRVKIVRRSSAQNEETDVVIIVREYREPISNGRGGRRLGLPLFSVQFTMSSSGVAVREGFACILNQTMFPLRPPECRHRIAA